MSSLQKSVFLSKVENSAALPIIVNGIQAYKFFHPDFLNQNNTRTGR